ncbi:hypothetical protein AK812_SmicGene36257 [Symbiodinium microadriaticum]|uniref:Uncharacterized protein n=1 Tax=Symbiodinium microadriaticum TaxID=2951 RepID=A0A1Q9CJC9_SYMMI|nr:hypothetical protein AK812_SmicGene36257 [Symbiodinium microadriaticum]
MGGAVLGWAGWVGPDWAGLAGLGWASWRHVDACPVEFPFSLTDSERHGGDTWRHLDACPVEFPLSLRDATRVRHTRDTRERFANASRTLRGRFVNASRTLRERFNNDGGSTIGPLDPNL